jgi:hypothetical protein
LKANPHNIGSILSQVLRFVVPLFQRRYVWNKRDHWAPLWADIRKVAERVLSKQPAKPHFLGAIVLDRLANPTGHLETRWLIDGQQRMTTIQLFLEAVCNLCATAGNEDYHKAFLGLTRNDHPLSKEPDQKFKVWPSYFDQEDFRRVMDIHSPADLRKAYGADADAEEVGHGMADAYLFFHRVLGEWFLPAGDSFKDRAEALFAAVYNHLMLVVIDLDHEDDAQLIFETLNARGTPLLPSDLIKNHLLHRGTLESEKPEALYKQYWQSFDKEKYWRKETGRGHAKRARIDVFFQNYLSVQRGEEVAVGHLYSDFQDHVEKTKTTAKAVLESVQKYARVFHGLDDPAPGSSEALFLWRLKTMEHLTAYPFLMELFVRYADQPDEIRQVLADVESFLVRRLICNLTARGYNRLFLDLAQKLSKTNGQASALVRHFLLASDAESNRWPRDDEFKTAWLDTPILRTVRKQRVRMILEALEMQLHTGKTEAIEFKEKLQIEHLLPRHWQKHWPLPEQPDAAAERARLLHTFGNLTLLTRKLNPAVSNGPWEKKQKQILEHSSLNLNRKLPDHWGENEIIERGKALFEVAKAIWPRPADVPKETQVN